jgi:hypothetical protein
MEENSPRPAASDYPALAECLKAYNQQLQHQQTHGATPGLPDELRPGATAGATAQVTGDMHVLESSGNATSGGSMSNSSGNTAFDYAYAYGLTEQKLDFGAMARGDFEYQLPNLFLSESTYWQPRNAATVSTRTAHGWDITAVLWWARLASSILAASIAFELGK